MTVDLGDRTKYIGGSDVGAVLGISRWRTPLEMWMLKTGLKPYEPLDSEAAKLGTYLEDYVAERFTTETGKKVRRVNKPYVHPTREYLQAHIDRDVVGEEALLECKTCSAWQAKAWADGEIPGDYIMQVYYYMLLTGYKKAYIAVLIGNQDFKWRELIRDDKAETTIQDMFRRIINFWENFVVPGVMPMDFKADDTDVLEELYPTNKIPVIIGIEDEVKAAAINAKLDEIQSFESDIAKCKYEISIRTADLMAEIKNSDGINTGTWEATWKVQGCTGKLDKEGLEKEYPGAYKKYYKPGKTRVFRKKNLLETNEEE
jgi:putative phage-type endonuclease